MLRRLIICLCAVLVSFPVWAADWRLEVDQLLADTDTASAESRLLQVASGAPSWHDLVACLEDARFAAAPVNDDCVLQTLRCKDNVDRPWALYIPPGYDVERPTPLLVILHGGVSRSELKDDPLGRARKSEWIETARANRWLVLFPYGQAGATWWDDVGMDNIRREIRVVKSRFNVDDDRVWLAGFSDGASAGFLQAMVSPTDFAAVVALNGHLGVGSLDGGLPTYAPNLAATPVYAVTTERDSLYPTAQMRDVLAMAREAGAKMVCRELPGEHAFDYAKTEIPRIASFLGRHPRDPHVAKIVWEAGDPRFGRCHWVSIDEIGTGPSAPWHRDFNATLVDDRVSVGFIPEPASFGVGVGKVVGDGYGASVGLKTGDVLIAAAGHEVKNADELDRVKARVRRGDLFPLTVRRASATVGLPGTLPPPKAYYVFKREGPSAAARVERIGNRFTIEGSRLGACRIFVHPEAVDLERPIQIVREGRVVFDAIIHPDPVFILRNFLAERDRRAIYVAEIKLPAQ